MQTVSFVCKKNVREFPGDPVVRTVLSVPGPQVQPLVWELRSCKPRGKAKKLKKKNRIVWIAGEKLLHNPGSPAGAL